MKIKTIFVLSLMFVRFSASAQDEAAYLKTHAVPVDNPEQLSESAYQLLAPYRIIMLGEMHGTNESAPFANGLANLFSKKGEQVQVGLEIPAHLMSLFLKERTNSSVFQSDFFSNPPFLDGRESLPWASLISKLNKDPNVEIFFFDINSKEENSAQRDSLMYSKIKAQYLLHPERRIITLSGNYHNRISDGPTMGSFIQKDPLFGTKLCSLNMEYKEGFANANFGKGLQVKALASYPSAYNSSEGFDRYLLLLPEKNNYPYSGFYYTKSISAAKMAPTK